MSSVAGVRFLKGHGTGNDFVVVPDPDGALTLTPELVRRLCDRRFGVGADGVLRVVRTACADTGLEPAVADAAEWFMDHHNADGSTAEMCGNGIRLYARYLVEAGLVEPGSHLVATRGGTKTVEIPADGGDVRVDMGPPVPLPLTGVATGSVESAVLGGQEFSGVAVSMGNPHLVCRVQDVPAVELTAPLKLSAEAFPDGVNVEFFEWVNQGRVRMRVLERGVGETLSCGTGACAVAVAALGSPGSAVEVDVPGGRLLVEWTDRTMLLSGPAEFVAEGVWRSRTSPVSTAGPVSPGRPASRSGVG